MKDELKDKQGKLFENEQKKEVKKISPEQQQEQENIFSESNRISPANKKIDKIEIVKTIGGDEINVADYIEENYISGQSTHYYKDLFYYPLADMFGVSRSVMDEYVKPYFVPVFINNFILARFPQKIINKMHEKNKYIYLQGRKYHFYQIMTKKADDEYRNFISDVEMFLNRVPKPTLKEFIKEYCEKYNLPIQLVLFDNLIGK